MPINYNDIGELISVEVRARTGMGKPLIELVLRYTTKNGKPQEYIYPTVPEDAHQIINQLLDKKLIPERQFEEVESQVKDLERELISSPYYRQ